MPDFTPIQAPEARVRPAIEPGVPFPPGTKFEFPLHDLKVGESFVVPLTERARVQRAVYKSHVYWKTRGRYTTRVEGDQVRVWRVS